MSRNCWPDPPPRKLKIPTKISFQQKKNACPPHTQRPCQMNRRCLDRWIVTVYLLHLISVPLPNEHSPIRTTQNVILLFIGLGGEG